MTAIKKQKLRVLVIGSGAREHALCWKIKSSPYLSQLFCAPGNPGIAQIAEIVAIKADQIDQLVDFVQKQSIDLTIVGPEVPLSLGIVDQFRAKNLRIFGPIQAAARLESSKAFCKEVMNAAGVLTARHKTFTDKTEVMQFINAGAFAGQGKDGPIVLKADGLAAGKGVYVATSKRDALQGLEFLYSEIRPDKVLVEEYLVGKEVSFIVATDGQRVFAFPPAHDYKRVSDNDQGPNTGGMGSVCPSPRFSTAHSQIAIAQIIEPMLAEMRKRAMPFSGFLYAGLMVGPAGQLHVIEFNARMGDPECQTIMSALNQDLLPIVDAFAHGGEASLDFSQATSNAASVSATSVCVVIAGAQYPQSSSQGEQISGIEFAEMMEGVTVFHAGTALNPRAELVTAGGRVLGVTARASNLIEARSRAYKACDMIQFKGCKLRRDIGIG